MHPSQNSKRRSMLRYSLVPPTPTVACPHLPISAASLAHHLKTLLNSWDNITRLLQFFGLGSVFDNAPLIFFWSRSVWSFQGI